MEAHPLTPTEVALIFVPAVVAYAAFTLVAVSAALGRRARAIAWIALMVVTAHVSLLWWLRYGFDPRLALRHGWSGFLTFQGALVLMWAALPGDTARGWRRWVAIGAWLLVSSGAIGAPFRHALVADFAIPVVVTGVVGLTGMVLAFVWLRRAP